MTLEGARLLELHSSVSVASGISHHDDSDGAHLTSFGIKVLTEEEAKENEWSPNVALLCEVY